MCKKKNITAFIKKLQTLSETYDDSLEKEVALYALQNYGTPEDICNFFKDLLQFGCACGMVGSLIYYWDTRAFFDKHYEEVIWLKTEYEESTGQPMNIPHQIKNHLAWFAFEETAYKLWEAD